MTTTKEQAKAAVAALLAIGETIREAKEVPSGVLYARLMQFMDLTAYTRVIDTLKGAGLVTEQAHVLRWVGPQPESKEAVV
jgi:hypothetical protein